MKEESKDFVLKKYWQELYIEFQSDPFDTRTDKKFCEDLGINRTTLAEWKSKNRKAIFREVNTKRKDFTAEFRSKAYKELYAKMGKDTNAIKLAFQLMGDLVERTENKTEYTTQEDKLRRINVLLQNIKSKQKSWQEGGAVDLEPSKLDGNEPGTTDVGPVE